MWFQAIEMLCSKQIWGILRNISGVYSGRDWGQFFQPDRDELKSGWTGRPERPPWYISLIFWNFKLSTLPVSSVSKILLKIGESCFWPNKVASSCCVRAISPWSQFATSFRSGIASSSEITVFLNAHLIKFSIPFFRFEAVIAVSRICCSE